MPEAAMQAAPYRLQNVPFAEADSATLAEWAGFRRQGSAGAPLDDPAWIRNYFDANLKDLYVYLLRESGSLRGVTSFLLKEWPLKWQLGEITLAQPRLRRLRLLGGTPNLPEEEPAYDMLFAELGKSDLPFDVIQLEEVPVESFLWKYLQESPLIRRFFRLYGTDVSAPHLEIQLQGDFDEYMKKFSAKTRNGLRRKVKKIREGTLGPMRFERYTKPEDVSPFLEAAVEVSKKTYQWSLLQKGLSRTELLKGRMLSAAANGWLRCYILFCNETACAFFVGFQHGDRFLLHETGFDPEFAKHSVGTVLHLLILEDLFAENTPRIFDLAAYSGWKAELSNASYLENKAMLFRRGAYTRFVQEGHRACQSISRGGAAALDRWQLKNRVKRMIRSASQSHSPNEGPVEPTAKE